MSIGYLGRTSSGSGCCFVGLLGLLERWLCASFIYPLMQGGDRQPGFPSLEELTAKPAFGALLRSSPSYTRVFSPGPLTD
jgi:hypothetical protein